MAGRAAAGLRRRWARFSRWLIGADSPQVFAELLRRYGEPSRAYHNLRHIRACLLELDRFGRSNGGRRIPPRDLVLAEAALWFHDAVYDPRRKDNEARSAAAFARALGAGLPAREHATVRRLILATKHDRAPRSNLARLIVDIDLSILGANPSSFADYERDIRREYAFVSAMKFRQGRAAVLRRFLRRRFIYATDFFRRRYERRARRNLRRALARIGGE